MDEQRIDGICPVSGCGRELFKQVKMQDGQVWWDLVCPDRDDESHRVKQPERVTTV